MPPRALIQVNGVDGSNDDLPINTLVQLSNDDAGGEVTYLWEVLDQPEGTADALSNSAIENPTLTPKKEGSYLVRLTVNAATATVSVDTVVVGIRELKSRQRIPAAMETSEVDPALGWKPATNRTMKSNLDSSADGGLLVVALPGVSVPGVGAVVRYAGLSTIKVGLPGQEDLLLVGTAHANVLAETVGPLAVVTGTPSGAAPTANGLAIARRFGLVARAEAGAPAVGDPVYLSDTGAPALAPGTNSRKIGRVVLSAAGSWRWVIDGAVTAW